MPEVVLLDAGPLGMVAHPRPAEEILAWLARLLAGGVEVLVAEIADYEVRRELLRAGLVKSIHRLQQLKATLGFVHSFRFTGHGFLDRIQVVQIFLQCFIGPSHRNTSLAKYRWLQLTSMSRAATHKGQPLQNRASAYNGRGLHPFVPTSIDSLSPPD